MPISRGGAKSEDMKNTAETVIIGGGVMGCSILYNLASRGMTDTMLIEKDALASGSTSRSQAILRMHYSNEVTARLAWESFKIFRDFEEITGGPSGYVRTGYFLAVDQGDGAALADNVAMHQRIGIDTEVVSYKDVREISPVLATREDEVFAYEPESGYADPYSLTTAYAQRARDLGAEVVTDTAVTGIETVNSRVTAVTTAGGRTETPVAVVAAGPWSKPFLDGVGVDVPLSTVRHQVVMVQRPAELALGHPAVGDIVNDLSTRPDAGDISLIGVGEDEFVGPDEYNQGVDMAMVQSAMAGLAKRIPDMAGARFRGGWSGLFTITPDWHPVLDRVEGIEGLYCAVGFSGHGFKLSPMIGVVMSELITKGKATSVDISMLGLGRFKEDRLLTSRYSMAVLA